MCPNWSAPTNAAVRADITDTRRLQYRLHAAAQRSPHAGGLASQRSGRSPVQDAGAVVSADQTEGLFRIELMSVIC